MAQLSKRHRVLVLMATFEGGRWIEEQLASIVDQREVDVTLLLRDDASTDDTVLRAQRLIGSSSLSCRIIRAERPGGSAGANFFALMQHAHAEGFDYVAFADQDDVWHETKLIRAIGEMRRTGCAGYSSAVEAFWPDGRTRRLTQRPRPTSADFLFEGAGQGCTFVISAARFTAARAVLASHADLLRLIHYHDWALYALLRVVGEGWHFDSQAMLRYRQHSGNDTGARVGHSGISKRLALIRSGWYSRQVDAILRLCIAGAGDNLPSAVSTYLKLQSVRAKFSRRLRLCAFTLRHGRRRWSDRLVVAAAALAGHLDPPRSLQVR